MACWNRGFRPGSGPAPSPAAVFMRWRSGCCAVSKRRLPRTGLSNSGGYVVARGGAALLRGGRDGIRREDGQPSPTKRQAPRGTRGLPIIYRGVVEVYCPFQAAPRQTLPKQATPTMPKHCKPIEMPRNVRQVHRKVKRLFGHIVGLAPNDTRTMTCSETGPACNVAVEARAMMISGAACSTSQIGWVNNWSLDMRRMP